MTWVMVFAGVGCGWTLLSLLSGERSRRVRHLEAETAAAPPAGQPAPPPGAAGVKAPATPAATPSQRG